MKALGMTFRGGSGRIWEEVDGSHFLRNHDGLVKAARGDECGAAPAGFEVHMAGVPTSTPHRGYRIGVRHDGRGVCDRVAGCRAYPPQRPTVVPDRSRGRRGVGVRHDESLGRGLWVSGGRFFAALKNDVEGAQ